MKTNKNYRKLYFLVFLLLSQVSYSQKNIDYGLSLFLPFEYNIHFNKLKNPITSGNGVAAYVSVKDPKHFFGVNIDVALSKSNHAFKLYKKDDLKDVFEFQTSSIELGVHSFNFF